MLQAVVNLGNVEGEEESLGAPSTRRIAGHRDTQSMKRSLLNLLTALSLLACMGAVMLWARDSAAARRRLDDAYYVVDPNAAAYGAVVLSAGVLPLAWLVIALQTSKRRRRRARGLCPACGYDPRATPGRCPECGHIVRGGVMTRS
jgi:hypothetical protein